MTITRRGETRTAVTVTSGHVRRHDLSRHWRNSRTLGRHDRAGRKYHGTGNYLHSNVPSASHSNVPSANHGQI